jgi:hypothetical protein
VELARGGEVFDLFSRYHFDAVVHGAQAHQSAQTRVSRGQLRHDLQLPGSR